jgi:hypothetical protein
MKELNLFYITGDDQKLSPQHIELFTLANEGDSDAIRKIVHDFIESIGQIVFKVQSLYAITDELLVDKLFESGIRTLRELIPLHNKEGFCKFLLKGISANIVATLHQYEV